MAAHLADMEAGKASPIDIKSLEEHEHVHHHLRTRTLSRAFLSQGMPVTFGVR